MAEGAPGSERGGDLIGGVTVAEVEDAEDGEVALQAPTPMPSYVDVALWPVRPYDGT